MGRFRVRKHRQQQTTRGLDEGRGDISSMLDNIMATTAIVTLQPTRIYSCLVDLAAITRSGVMGRSSDAISLSSQPQRLVIHLRRRKRYHPHLAPCDNITSESLIQQLKLAEKDFILCRDGKGGIQIDTLEMASTKPTKDMSEGAGTIPVIFNIYRDKHKDESSSLAEEGVQ